MGRIILSHSHEVPTNAPFYPQGGPEDSEAGLSKSRESDPTAVLVVAGVLFVSGLFSLLRLIAGLPALILEWEGTEDLIELAPTIFYCCGLIAAPFLASRRWSGYVGSLLLLGFFFFRQAMRAASYFSEARPVEVAKLETHSYVMGGAHSLLALGAAVLVVSLLVPRTLTRIGKS